MAKKAKKTKSLVQVLPREQKIIRYLIAFPILAFLIKMAIMFNIDFGGWLGADGENYTAGVDGLLANGFFSDEPKLSYWPAGYPLLLWPFAEISATKFYYFINFLQSIFFAFSTYFLTSKLLENKFKYLAFTASLLISFNPTLSLSSLTVGYEAPIASCLMMILGLSINLKLSTVDRKFWSSLVGIASWFALSIFMQPRFLLVGVIYILILAYQIARWKTNILILIVSFFIMAVGPSIMIFRNIEVLDQATISTNLGVTMAIGAGDETSGGYDRTGPDVPCEAKDSSGVVTDNEKVKCVINWYISNPLKTIQLAYNKSQYFWSPWSGPLANGTMARNPWLKISPTQNIKKNPDGAKLVTGVIGKTISYSWIFGQIFFLIWGYRELRRLGNNEKLLANLILMPVVLSWLVSIGTIGDHRFRVPTMSLSLILQCAGLLALRKKLTKAL